MKVSRVILGLIGVIVMAMPAAASAKAWRDKEPFPAGSYINIELKREPVRKRSAASVRRAKIKAAARARAKAAKIQSAKKARVAKSRNSAKSAPKVCSAPQARLDALQRIGLPSLAMIATPLVRPIKQIEAWSADMVALIDEREDAIQYLVRTATPGGTMLRQGVRLSIERLHPEFALRLARAIREARANGLPSAGIYSAYRAPGWGVGGFGDKFRSNHAIGQAVDMAGIGRPGSKYSRIWFAIAGRNKLFNPYGPSHRAEWNHYQPQMIRSIEAGMPVRATISKFGPIDLTRMWEVGQSLIRNVAYLGPPPEARRYARKRHRTQLARHHHHHRHYARRSRYAAAH